MQRAVLRPFGAIASSAFEAVPISGRAKSYSVGADSLFLRPVQAGQADISAPFSESWPIYACIRQIERAIAQVPLRVYASMAADAPEVPEPNPLRKLLDRPNRRMSGPQFRSASAIHRKLSGENLWFLMTGQGEPIVPADAPPEQKIPLPIQIVPINGHAAQCDLDKWGLPSQWWYSTRDAATPVKFPAASVVHFYDYDPANPTRGLGDAEVAQRQASIGYQAERYLEATQRAGGPGAFMRTSKPLTASQLNDLQAQIDDETQDPDAAGKLKLVTGIEDIIPNPATPKEMQARETVIASAENICSILGVPPPIIGLLTNATFRNMEEAWRQFWLSIVSYLKAEEDTINEHFVKRLADPKLAGLRVGYDLSGIEALRADDLKRYDWALRAAPTIGWEYAAETMGLDVEPMPEPVAPEPPSKRNRAITDRAGYYRAYEEKVLRPNDLKLERAIRAWLDDYEQALRSRVAALTSKRDVTSADLEAAILLNKATWEETLRAVVRIPLRAVVQDALDDLATQLNVLALPATDPALIAALTEQEIKLAQDVTRTLEKRVRAAIADALASGGGVVEEITSVLPDLEGNLARIFETKEIRAQVIARTETSRAANTARTEELRRNGFLKHEWVTSHDDRVRDTHVSLDGQVREIGQPFKPGLTRPGDPDAPASETVQCRCVTAAVIED